MGKYVVALFCDLCKHSQAWNRIPRDQMAGLIGEYKALAEELGTRYGSFHRNFVGDGHLFLFENADAAVRFGLKLIGVWREEFVSRPALQGLPPIPLRVGAHFGESMQIGTGEAWVGRVNNMANRMQGVAKPDTILISEGILDLIDFPLYEIQRVAPRKLQGNCVARRTLYHVASFDDAASAAKPPHEVTAEQWYLRGVAMIGTAKEDTDEEEHCYVEALRLRPDYAEAHNAYGVLLRARGDPKRAEQHYVRALRVRPEYHKAHYNYANLLTEKGDPKRAGHHYAEALRVRPDYAEAHYNYAILLSGGGDAEGAEEHYRRAYELAPSDPDIKSAFERRAWER